MKNRNRRTIEKGIIRIIGLIGTTRTIGTMGSIEQGEMRTLKAVVRGRLL